MNKHLFNIFFGTLRRYAYTCKGIDIISEIFEADKKIVVRLIDRGFIFALVLLARIVSSNSRIHDGRDRDFADIHLEGTSSYSLDVLFAERGGWTNVDRE